MHHRGRIAERELLAEPRPPLVVVDSALDLGPHLGELALRLQPAALDAGERVPADHLVRVGARGHDAMLQRLDHAVDRAAHVRCAAHRDSSRTESRALHA